MAIQRASGAIAARTDRRLVVLQHRYAITRRLMWEHCVAAMEDGRLDPRLLAAFGRFLLLWNELTSLAVTDGYRAAERDILARSVEARRGALQELLGVVPDDAVTAARLRRTGVRHGLDPDRAYCLVAIAPRPESDPIPERPGIGEEELEVLAGRIGHLLGATAPGAEGVGAGIRLPAVLPLLGRIAILAPDDWAGVTRVPKALDTVLGGLAAAAERPGPEGQGSSTGTSSSPRGWPSAHRPSTASVRWPPRMPISSMPRAPRSGSAGVAGSRTLMRSRSSDSSSRTGSWPMRSCVASSARSSRTNASARSSSRRSRPTSTPART